MNIVSKLGSVHSSVCLLIRCVIFQLEKSKFAMHIKLGDSSDQGTENAISILHADLEQLIKERYV